MDLTKAFDLVSRSGLFKILQKIGCLPKLLSIVTSFHQDMHSMVCFDGATSNAFPVSMLLQYAFVDCTEGVYVRTRSDGKLFNIARLCAKTKAYVVFIRELLFADDAALTSHSKEGLQHLVDKLSHASKEFGLTISLRKTNILAQGAESPPVITIDNTEMEVVDTFTYLGSTVSSSTSLDTEISCRIAKAAAAMANSTSECGAMTC